MNAYVHLAEAVWDALCDERVFLGNFKIYHV